MGIRIIQMSPEALSGIVRRAVKDLPADAHVIGLVEHESTETFAVVCRSKEWKGVSKLIDPDHGDG